MPSNGSCSSPRMEKRSAIITPTLRSKMMRKSGSYRVPTKAVEQTLWSTSTTAWCFSLHACSGGPAAAQGLVELDDRDKMEPPGGRERQFSVEETPLGGEHVQIICEPPLVTQIGKVRGRPQCRDLFFLC